MKFQETGRFGRITKNIRKLGFGAAMDKVLFDSVAFPHLKKKEQTQYIETVMVRMEKSIGLENTKKVLQECGAQCCGKSWSRFAKETWDRSKSPEDFFVNLNREEEKYATRFSYDPGQQSITVIRDQCICGLINKGNVFGENRTFCHCSIGHMSVFFNAVFSVDSIQLRQSIYAGDKRCEWAIQLK